MAGGDKEKMVTEQSVDWMFAYWRGFLTREEVKGRMEELEQAWFPASFLTPKLRQVATSRGMGT